MPLQAGLRSSGAHKEIADPDCRSTAETPFGGRFTPALRATHLAPSTGSRVWSGTIILEGRSPVTPSTRLRAPRIRWARWLCVGSYHTAILMRPPSPEARRTVGASDCGEGIFSSRRVLIGRIFVVLAGATWVALAGAGASSDDSSSPGEFCSGATAATDSASPVDSVACCAAA